MRPCSWNRPFYLPNLRIGYEGTGVYLGTYEVMRMLCN